MASGNDYRQLPAGDADDSSSRAELWARQGDFRQPADQQNQTSPQSDQTEPLPSVAMPSHTRAPCSQPPRYDPHPLNRSSCDNAAATPATAAGNSLRRSSSPPPQKVAFDEEHEALHRSTGFRAHRWRMGTKLEEAPVEVRHTHDYFLRRPRPLIVEHNGHVLQLGEYGKLDPEHPTNSYDMEHKAGHHFRNAPAHGPEHHPDSLKKQRERMDLFVDLIWVGIISNISEHFTNRVFAEEKQINAAIGEFILLFIPAFRIWVVLQHWLNMYYMDDYFQKMFVVWIMILGLVWGNNAPYLLESFNQDDNFVIASYLVAVASFSLAQLIYSRWLPWLRRPILISFLAGMPALALWVALTVVSTGFLKDMLLMAAIIAQGLESIFLASPLADRFLGMTQIRQATDNRTMIKRFESFFIIALGEGVFLLIRQSPLGKGLDVNLGRGIQALLIYYFLNWTYFHGDVSKRFIHPIDRRWWIKFLWQSMHLPLFASLVILSSGTLFLVQYKAGAEVTDSEQPTSEAATSEHVRRAETFTGHTEAVGDSSGGEQIRFDARNLEVAIATTCVATAATLFAQLVMALLCRSVDEPHSLRVSNQWLRMTPRAIAVVLLSTIWLAPINDPSTVLGIVLTVVAAVTGLEQFMGIMKHARLLEPKEASLTPVLSSQS